MNKFNFKDPTNLQDVFKNKDYAFSKKTKILCFKNETECGIQMSILFCFLLKKEKSWDLSELKFFNLKLFILINHYLIYNFVMKKIEQNFKQINLNDSKCFVFKQVAECQSLSEAVDLINSKREPFILKNFDLGPCVQKWSVDYLKSVVKDKQVKIHVSSVSDMDFLKKNFIYR
jgi:hypothetical protein